jgi:CheY-like chemotaxis protein
MAKRILIVDDDPNIRRFVTLALTDDSPYSVSAVSSAEAALLHISRQRVDLLFTDIHMPGMNGLELVERVHELDPETAVIVFTVSPQDLSAERAAELKVDCLLEKPVETERLRLAVDLLIDPMKLLPRPSQVVPETMPAVMPPSTAPARGTTPLNERLSQRRSPRATKPLAGAPVAMRLTSDLRHQQGRSFNERQIERMRHALRDLALEPDVQCAVLADISGIVLTHWSRRRDINVTVVAALAAGNSLAMAEIGRNMGQCQPGNLVIHEGQDQSIVMATMGDLLLLLGIGPKASLGWARITTMRACEAIAQIACGSVV